ncbi:Myc-type, basic helix-loop-helix domain-containing protein [Cokeromyces recurvatus]|uniref:Myc-type, basic helix-loop-helix domain-containing protein n=1 Tax=Cokeromyces recurvatus TaxID=90255 RepID=UPI00221F9CA5|nr:Myc-type, basic helix-loop-helix domain-containing protein [Cokeromyces recurvatus]KAI7908208.1 Myc-type, basic helix-loop-helix domain-containing protein [Cokeromyces recurvatus]
MTSTKEIEERRSSFIDPNSRTLYPISSLRHHYSTDSSHNNHIHSSSSPQRESSSDPILHTTAITNNLLRTSLLNNNNSLPSSRRSSIVTTPENMNASLPSPIPLNSSSWRRESLPSISKRDHHLHHHHHSAPSSRRGSEQHHSTPYSRSPELRVSHKLAERKRRKEMKDLFDDLRDLLPLDKGLKTSKWEILSKALEYIHILHQRESMMEKEKTELLNELNALKR